MNQKISIGVGPHNFEFNVSIPYVIGRGAWIWNLLLRILRSVINSYRYSHGDGFEPVG
jgi:hypothetical protein